MQRRDDTGAAAVELALVIPILLGLLLGIIDMGFAFNAKIALTGAAREGVRAVALGSEDEARTRVEQALASNGQLQGLSVVTTPCASDGDDAVVEVSATVGTLLPGLADIDLGARSVMRCGG